MEEDLNAIYSQTVNLINESKGKVDQLATAGKTSFHQIFTQCKIKMDDAAEKIKHPVLTEIFYPAVINHYMYKLI